MYKLSRTLLIIALCLLHCIAFAQNTGEDGKSFMYSEGKIYVVLAVVVTIVLGIFIYLIHLDGKIKKLEKNG